MMDHVRGIDGGRRRSTGGSIGIHRCIRIIGCSRIIVVMVVMMRIRETKGVVLVMSDEIMWMGVMMVAPR